VLTIYGTCNAISYDKRSVLLRNSYYLQYVWSVQQFCSSWVSCLPGMLLKCFLNNLQMVPAAHVITSFPFLLHSTYAVFMF
jgi:hypothetical protein